MLTQEFVIEKYPLLPNEMCQIPAGEVLLCSFLASQAYAWVKVSKGEDRTMGIVAIPNGGPYKLETDVGFMPPVHAGSFLKKSTITSTNRGLDAGIAFHVFVWQPNRMESSLCN